MTADTFSHSSSMASSTAELSHQQRFFQYFQHEITALQDQMDRLVDTALIGGERRDAMDHCLAGITRLSAEVKDAAGYLPAYDQRTYGEAVKALQDKLEETRKSHAPRPKFSFKSKSPSALSLSDAAELAAEKRKGGGPGFLSPSPNASYANTPSAINTPANEAAQDEPETIPEEAEEEHAQGSGSHVEINTETKPQAPPTDPAKDTDRPSLSTTATSTSISNQSNTHIILPSSAPNTRTPCSLSKLTNCVVDLSVPTTATAPFASITITNVSSSLLLCGSVSGPAHITGVKKSVLVIKCRQFRMHECQDVTVYLHCTSRPIIEDCKGIRFAELPKFHVRLSLRRLSVYSWFSFSLVPKKGEEAFKVDFKRTDFSLLVRPHLAPARRPCRRTKPMVRD
jgi:tubulin-specific chaperone C